MDGSELSAEAALDRLATSMLSEGLNIAGAIQRTVAASDRRTKRMDLVLLPDQTTVQISADLPPGTPGCVLDPNVFESVTHDVTRRIAKGADAVILSKFAQRETERRGFLDAIVATAELGIPLVIGVAPARLEDFEAFLGLVPDRVEADVAYLKDWLTGAR